MVILHTAPVYAETICDVIGISVVVQADFGGLSHTGTGEDSVQYPLLFYVPVKAAAHSCEDKLFAQCCLLEASPDYV